MAKFVKYFYKTSQKLWESLKYRSKKLHCHQFFSILPQKKRYCNKNLLPLHRSDLISPNEGDFVIRQSNCLSNCKDLSGYVIAVISPDNGAADSKNVAHQTIKKSAQ